jgi:hypothetical protein
MHRVAFKEQRLPEDLAVFGADGVDIMICSSPSKTSLSGKVARSSERRASTARLSATDHAMSGATSSGVARV